MKLNARSLWITLLLLMMSAIPAVAQFEISPDHFDDNPPSSQQAAQSDSMTSLKRQIAGQKKLLAGYQDRLLQKSALVEKARQAFRNSSSATARNDFLRQKSELRELRQSLSGSVRDGQLALARLERQQQALRASARVRHHRGSTTGVLSASN
jgi:multidrug efflux pump subunit AcrA (membrane-fusion protein)